MIAPIDDANHDLAITLLSKGFPDRSSAFWGDALDRIKRLGGNSALNVPIGHLMFADANPVGVALTIASRHVDAHLGPRTHVNFAAWHVEPEHRWRAPLMLRALVRIPCDVLTDLTPSASVRALLPAFGFQQITRGVAINLAALHRGGGRVAPLEEGKAEGIAPEITALLCAHAQFGNIPALLHCRDGAAVALLFRVSRWRGFNMASVIYCGSNRQLLNHLGAVSAFLRKRGIALIKLDALVGMAPPPGWFRPDREVKFARGVLSPDVTDYAGSELALLDI